MRIESSDLQQATKVSMDALSNYTEVSQTRRTSNEHQMVTAFRFVSLPLFPRYVLPQSIAFVFSDVVPVDSPTTHQKPSHQVRSQQRSETITSTSTPAKNQNLRAGGRVMHFQFLTVNLGILLSIQLFPILYILELQN